MVNTIHIELRSGLLVESVSAYCWFISISSRSFLLRFNLIFALLVLCFSGNCLSFIVFGYGFGIKNNNCFTGFYDLDMVKYWYGVKSLYSGQMALVARLCVGMHLAHFIQWMLDLISVKQVQWKNDTRMGLDKVLWSGFIIWYKVALNYSFMDSTKCTVVWRCLLLGLSKESRCSRAAMYLNTLYCYGYGFNFRDRDLRWSLIMGGGGRVGSYGHVLDHCRGAHSWLGLIKPSAENLWIHDRYQACFLGAAPRWKWIRQIYGV